MEKCKYCQADLEENSAVCPNCGKDNAQEDLTTAANEPETSENAQAEAVEEKTEAAEEAAAPAQEPEEDIGPQAEKVPGRKSTPTLIAAIALLLVLIAALVALVYSGIHTNQNQPGITDPTGETTMEESTGETAAETQEPVETTEATIPADGNPDDVTCKGTYTAADEEVIADTDAVVAELAGSSEPLTNGLLQVYYWMEVRNFLSQYGSYASYFGLDVSQPLDTQTCGLTEDGWTWQQYFLNAALESWHNYQAMAETANARGYVLDEEYQSVLDTMEEDLETASVQSGFENAAQMLTTNLGAAGTMENYKKFTTLYYTGYGYYAQETGKYDPSEQEISDYFDANQATFEENGITKDTVTVDVRHILIMPEGATSETIRTDTFSEEAWTSSEAKAKEILDSWLAGEKTEDSFAALAAEHSQDEGSKDNGGLYAGITEGQMVTAFNDWSFDPTRNVGDYDIVKTEFGYHIMYFCGSSPVWQSYAKQSMTNEFSQKFIQDIVDEMPMTVNYSAIKLALVS